MSLYSASRWVGLRSRLFWWTSSRLHLRRCLIIRAVSVYSQSWNETVSHSSSVLSSSSTPGQHRHQNRYAFLSLTTFHLCSGIVLSIKRVITKFTSTLPSFLCSTTLDTQDCPDLCSSCLHGSLKRKKNQEKSKKRKQVFFPSSMDHHVPSHYVIINFVIKGGPPWGFRIKQRGHRVVVSRVSLKSECLTRWLLFLLQVNCGGRAVKIGLKLHDEIIAVNNLEVDKQPLTLTLERQPNDNDQRKFLIKQMFTFPWTHRQIEDYLCNSVSCVSCCTLVCEPLQLTKLDFTYQLIKHTINRQLHLTVKRYVILFIFPNNNYSL